MAVFKAAVLIFLAVVPVISPLPIPQTAENKGKGRSYPLIISHYSNVRNSKYDNPPTEAPISPVVESIDPKPLEKDDVQKEAPSLHTDEKKPDAGVSSSSSDVDEEDAPAQPVAAQPTKAQEIKVADEEKIEGDGDKKIQDEKADNNDSEKADQDAIPKKDSDSEAADGVSKNESVLAAVDEDSLPTKTASPSNEKEDKITEDKDLTTKVEAESPPITDSKITSNGDDSVATTLTNAKEETSQTSLAVEEKKPAEAALDDKSTPEMESSASASKTPASSDDSAVKQEESPANIAKVDDVVAPANSPADDKVIQQDKTMTEQEEVKAPVVEPTEVESSRSGDLKAEVKNEFFEEDRSFKDRPEEAILAVIRQGALDEQREKLANKNLDVLQAEADDNEGIRLERDDKKTEKKDKEKEKFFAKPLLKEKKPTKLIVSDDPVQEVLEYELRGGRAQEDSASQSGTEPTVVEKAAEEEPIVLAEVPSNYPVVLPNGESTLSDKVKPEDLEKAAVEESIVSVPSNHPVVLPNGESTLSDKIKPEDTKESTKEDKTTGEQ